MKKILLLIVTLLFVFTLSACTEEVPTLVDFDLLETTVSDNDTSIAALETELAALEASLVALQGDSGDADLLIMAIQTDIDLIETALEAADIMMRSDIAAVNVLVAAMQVQLDLLTIELGEEVFNLQTQIKPLHMLETPVTEIVIAHTNDVHGRVNADSWAGSMGMATIKNIVDALRATYDNTFLIDAGDILHGTTFSTLEEGESMINVMNEVGYDLMVPGNHDFNYGQDRLLELELLADFDMISGNIEYSVDDSEFMSPYVIQEFGDVTVGFFGLTTPETLYKTHPDNVTGLNFLDPAVQAAAIVAELDPLVDIIILVAHIGLDDDTLITSEDIAIAVPGIDVIIDGHSHTVLADGMMVGDTLIVSTGEYMKNFGVFSLSIQDGKVIGYEVKLIDADLAEDLAFGDNSVVQDYIDEITTAQDLILDVVVGQTGLTLMGERNYVRSGETTLGNIIADSMLVVTSADIAITNGGGIRASIPEGDVTLGDVITVLPFGNIIATIELTGQEILDSLEHGTSSYPGASGKFPHVAGMTFDIDLDAVAGSRVVNLMIGGVSVNLSATYTVATNDFLAAGGDGYTIFATKAIVGEFMGLHEALEDMFTIDTDIALPVMGRITVINNMDIFISEYIEGGSYNKAIELYNPTGADIVLDDYSLILYSNGSIEPAGTLDLSGITLVAGEVLVICHEDFDPTTLTAQCDIFVTQFWGGDEMIANFNGDDAVVLDYDGIAIDTIGRVGQEGDNGSTWFVVSVDALGDPESGGTKDYTLVRVTTVTGPSREFVETQWVVYPKDTLDQLGTHTVD